jgi:YD repeat-containing protein
LSCSVYDANGNTLSDPSGKSYTWDFENRLTQAVVPGTNGGTTTFKYDPFGRRIQKSGPTRRQRSPPRTRMTLLEN